MPPRKIKRDEDLPKGPSHPLIFTISPAVIAEFTESSSSHLREENTVLPLSSPKGLFQHLESFVFRCSEDCSAHCCVNHRETRHDDDEPLLSDKRQSPARAGGISMHPNQADVVEWMRRRLAYFFMTPMEKYWAKHRIPFKLFTQILKLLIVTLQLISFGTSRSAHVVYGESSTVSFSHLYLKDWEPDYETLNYPPATGKFAIYQIKEFYENVGHTIIQINDTEKNALGSYRFSSEHPSVKLCAEMVSNSSSLGEGSEISCFSFLLRDTTAEQFSDPDSVKDFINKNSITIDWPSLLRFQIYFDVITPVLTKLQWSNDIECFEFNVMITLEKAHQSGMMTIALSAPFHRISCSEPTRPWNESVEADSQRGGQSKRCGDELSSHADVKQTNFQPTLRRILLMVLDSIATVLGICSLAFCTRSIIRGFSAWKETVVFFNRWFTVELYGEINEFIRPWLMLISVNDLLIIGCSVYFLATSFTSHENATAISYAMGINSLLVWSGILRYFGFSYKNTILIRALLRSVPSLARFFLCALALFFAFAICGWVVLGPFNIKFRTFISTLECLYSLLNGDEQFVTYRIVGEDSPSSIYYFSRLYLYSFISLFTYVVLNLCLTLVFEAYMEVKDMKETCGRAPDSPMWLFIGQNECCAESPLYRYDDIRPDLVHIKTLAFGSYYVRQRKKASTTSGGETTNSQIPSNSGRVQAPYTTPGSYGTPVSSSTESA
ncbi:unnamed protein product [Calicophoron daubneyi]|uniref:Polycystin cation channel PKD1/PKD2 domain-containing protein n=1 Tax=Calicophoron daubneyi TaxID=300641 RepID=A0AAV2TB36_CALDB